MCGYDIVTREAKQPMLPPGNYEANINDVKGIMSKFESQSLKV